MANLGTEMVNDAEKSTLDIEIIDIHGWEAEEGDREDERIKELLTKSVIASEGNPGMVNRALKTGVTNPQKHKCHAAFIWYTIEQQSTLPGETAYEDQSEWVDRAVNLGPLHLEAAAEDGRIDKNRMNRILKLTRELGKTHFATKEVDNLCRKDLKPFTDGLKEKDKNLKRPAVGIYSYKLGWCGMQLGSASEYNDHVRDIHGVKLEIQEDEDHETSTSDQDNSTWEPPAEEGTTKALKIMVPTLKRISANTGNYIPMNRMRAKPGRKEVEEGIEELKNVLAADGNWARDTGTRKTPLDAYGHVILRMKELVHEADWPAMERKYHQLSGRT